MNILVTGGCGFIGSNFIEYVLKHTDANVVNVDSLTYAGKSYHPRSDRYRFSHMSMGDPLVEQLLTDFQPDYIINFAAETHVDRSITSPEIFVQTNVVDTFKFIQNVYLYTQSRPHVRFVHVSTDEVYGQLNETDPAFTEDTPYTPNSPYSATKASSDHLVRAYQHTYGLPAIITNCSNNYGPRQFPEKLIPLTIHRALTNQKIPLYGTGLNIRDWLFVEDHCDALYTVLTKGKIGSKYNIGGNAERTNVEVIKSILKLMNKPESLIEYVEDRKGHDFRYAINSNRIQSELGWEPTVTFEQGLARTIEWYTFNMEWLEQCVR